MTAGSEAQVGQLSPTQALIQGVLTGQVPHQVRLFAAQGLLPIAREDLFRLQAVLTADPDEVLAAMAAASLREADSAVIVSWLASGDANPIELDLLVRVVRKQEVWAAVARHPQVSDETLCLLARHGSPEVLDIVVTNQVRILDCLEILDNLRANPGTGQVVLRRVREFEEQFIEKMAHQFSGQTGGGAGEDEAAILPPPVAEPVNRIGSVVEALLDIGGRIPSEEELTFELADDPALVEAVERAGSAFSRIIRMNIKERINLALKGSREDHSVLINSRSKLVLRAILTSPKISDSEVEMYAASKSVSDEVIRIITQNPRFLRRYGVIVALAGNPKTPVTIAMRMLPQLSPRDLKILSRERGISEPVRRKAKEMVDHPRR